MKKILVLSAVLLGAVTASQADVFRDIGVSVRLPFLPRVVARVPVPVVVPAPAVVCEAPRQVYAPSVAVCAPAPVVHWPAPRLYGPTPAYYGHGRPWQGGPRWDFRHDDRGWGRDGHHR